MYYELLRDILTMCFHSYSVTTNLTIINLPTNLPSNTSPPVYLAITRASTSSVTCLLSTSFSQGLFAGWTIVDAKETTLSGNLLKKDENRFSWNVGSSQYINHVSNNQYEADEIGGNDVSITLNPMEIRTFILTVHKSSS